MFKIFLSVLIVFLCPIVAFSDIDFVENQIIQNEKEEAVCQMASDWMNANNYPVEGEDGKIMYLFGVSMPILLCTPLKVSQIELEEGEVLSEIPQIGDTRRWHLTPIQSGENRSLTTIIVKPLIENIETNLVLATNRRIYTIKLISDPEKYTPKIAFKYPESEKLKWQKIIEARKTTKEKNIIVQTGENIFDLDFNYQILGDDYFKPNRVYNNGRNTIIHMPEKMKTSMPILLTYNSSKELVNYRIKDNILIVDQIFHKAILVSGIGRNKKQVVILHEERANG